MVKAIGYVRRSTDRQEESLDQQRAKLEAFASARGWQLVAVHADDAISGSELDRPGLAKLLADAEKRADVGAVLAWDRNRLARPKDPVDGLMLERRILQAWATRLRPLRGLFAREVCNNRMDPIEVCS